MMVLLTDFCWSNIDQEGSRTFNFQRLPVESLPFQDLLLTTSTNDTRTIESFQPFIVNVKSEQGTIRFDGIDKILY